MKKQPALCGARFLILFFLGACGVSDQDSTDPVTDVSSEAASKAITAELMRGYVKELADDKYEGRGPGSAGDAAARSYLIHELEKLGLFKKYFKTNHK